MAFFILVVLVTMTETISNLLFKKFMNKIQGTAERMEDGKELLITFNNVEGVDGRYTALHDCSQNH